MKNSSASSNETRDGNTTLSLVSLKNEVKEEEKKEVPQISPAKLWAFTLHNWKSSDLDEIIEKFKEIKAKYIIGREMGDSEESPHLQGYVEFEKKLRPFSLHLNQEIHWGKAGLKVKSKNPLEIRKHNIKYCSKEDEEPFSSPEFNIPKDPMRGLKPNAFQQEVLDIVKKQPDNRTIYWYWDKKGNIGKTTLVKSLCMKYPEECILTGGKANDAKYQVASAKVDPRIIFFNYTRSKQEYVSYEAIESMKDGIFASGKYESKMKLFNCPHVIIFANFPPITTELSLDRWKITEIRDGELIRQEIDSCHF